MFTSNAHSISGKTNKTISSHVGDDKSKKEYLSTELCQLYSDYRNWLRLIENREKLSGKIDKLQIELRKAGQDLTESDYIFNYADGDETTDEQIIDKVSDFYKKNLIKLEELKKQKLEDEWKLDPLNSTIKNEKIFLNIYNQTQNIKQEKNKIEKNLRDFEKDGQTFEILQINLYQSLEQLSRENKNLMIAQAFNTFIKTLKKEGQMPNLFEFLPTFFKRISHFFKPRPLKPGDEHTPPPAHDSTAYGYYPLLPSSNDTTTAYGGYHPRLFQKSGDNSDNMASGIPTKAITGKQTPTIGNS